jgi:hypothetical protein
VFGDAVSNPGFPGILPGNDEPYHATSREPHSYLSFSQAISPSRPSSGERMEPHVILSWVSTTPRNRRPNTLGSLPNSNTDGSHNPAGQSGQASELTINELLVKLLEHAKKHYRKPSGELTSEVQNYLKRYATSGFSTATRSPANSATGVEDRSGQTHRARHD